MQKALVRLVLAGVIVLFLAIQAIPYGRNHTNPPVRMEPPWDSPQTRELVVRACYDCHSNETVWPWYSNIAPLSWIIQQHVDEGRKKVNYSRWDLPQEESDDSAETVQEETMPPWNYVILHPRAKFSSAERQALIRGLETTFGKKEREKEGEDEQEHEENEDHEEQR